MCGVGKLPESVKNTHRQTVSTKEEEQGSGLPLGQAKPSAGVFAGVVFEEKRGKSVLG